MTTKPTREERLQSCLNFFRSVIQSGEEWTSICEAEYGLAVAPDPDFLPFAEQTADQREINALRGEINALRGEIAWLRETSRQMIKQLVDHYAVVPPPTPVFVPEQPLPSPLGTRAMSLIDLSRLNQLLAVERTATDVCSATKRDAFRLEAGNIRVPIVLMTELIRALNQRQEDQP